MYLTFKPVSINVFFIPSPTGSKFHHRSAQKFKYMQNVFLTRNKQIETIFFHMSLPTVQKKTLEKQSVPFTSLSRINTSVICSVYNHECADYFHSERYVCSPPYKSNRIHVGSYGMSYDHNHHLSRFLLSIVGTLLFSFVTIYLLPCYSCLLLRNDHTEHKSFQYAIGSYDECTSFPHNYRT